MKAAIERRRVRRGARGFTLVELAISSAIWGVIALSIYTFMLEARISGARLEAEIELQRQAALAGEWIARDVRAADAVEPVGGALEVIAPGERRVVYRVDATGLARVDGEVTLRIAKGVSAVSARRLARGWSVELVLVRPLVLGREVRIHREVMVADRR